MRKILVTGGCGFIGSNFINKLLSAKKGFYDIVNVDYMTYAANESNLKNLDFAKSYRHIPIDIGYDYSVRELFENFEFDVVIHFAAESHVDNSIASPSEFIKTNIMGTFNLLEGIRTHWKDKPENRFIHVSTDEVYGSLDVGDPAFTSETAYDPRSPYSASKASSDHLVSSYYHTYGLPVLITNCSNNYGENQHVEKLIPKTITRALNNEDIPIYGDGMNIRDWIYVGDHCEAILKVGNYGHCGQKYLIGADCERTNIEVATAIIRMTGSSSKIEFVTDRAGHDRRYAINTDEMLLLMGWKAKTNFEEGIKKTIEYYEGLK